MSKIFVTADLHLNHANIIRYCNRPFADVWEMNEQLVSVWNKTVSENDMVYHLGDFCFRKTINGIYQGINYWKERLNGEIILVSGSHDAFLTIKQVMIMSGNKTIFMRHDPVYHSYELPQEVDYVLCGHVHNKWKYITVGNTKVINVGTDVSDFQPNQLAEVIRMEKEYGNERLQTLHQL